MERRWPGRSRRSLSGNIRARQCGSAGGAARCSRRRDCPARSGWPRGLSVGTGLDVVAVDQVLVAQVELAVADDRMGPDGALGTANFGLGIELEAPVFAPTFGRCLDQHHGAAPFIKAIEHSVRKGNRTFAELAALGPDLIAALEILTHPTKAVGVAV